MNTSIILRHDTNFNKEKSNRILKDGEVFIESTNSGRFFYVGDGHTQLKDLQISTVIPSQIQDIISDINDYNEVTLTSDTNDTTVAKTYHLYQNETEVGQIKIPLDMVVSQAQIITATDETDLISGNKYIEFTIANSNNSKIYLAVDDVIITYTAAQNAQEIQLSISNEYVMSAEIVEVPVSKLISDQFCELIFYGGDAGGTSIISNLTPTYTLGTNLINNIHRSNFRLYDENNSIQNIIDDGSDDSLFFKIFNCDYNNYNKFLSGRDSYNEERKIRYNGSDFKKENILSNLQTSDPQYCIVSKLNLYPCLDKAYYGDDYEGEIPKEAFFNTITISIINQTKNKTITSTFDATSTKLDMYQPYDACHDGINDTIFTIPFYEGISEIDDQDIIDLSMTFNINLNKIGTTFSSLLGTTATNPSIELNMNLGYEDYITSPKIIISEK